MPHSYTHRIINFKDKDTSTLARLQDGMAIAARAGLKVGFGEDPRQQGQRVFIGKPYAMAFLRFLADEDHKQRMAASGAVDEGLWVANVEEVEGDRRIITAEMLQ
jgi:hypothetical protein